MALDDEAPTTGGLRRLAVAVLATVGLFIGAYVVLGALWIGLDLAGRIAATCLVVLAFVASAVRWRRLRIPIAVASAALLPVVTLFVSVSNNGLIGD